MPASTGLGLDIPSCPDHSEAVTSLQRRGAAMTGLEYGVRVAVAAMFFVSAVGKLARWDAFGQAVLDYKVLPSMLVPAVVRTVPLAELAGASLLIVPNLQRAGALLLALLLTAFSAAIAVNLRRGAQIPCGCFGLVDARPIRPSILFRNLALLAVLLTSVLASPEEVPSRQIAPIAVTVTVVLSLVALLARSRRVLQRLHHLAIETHQ